MYSRAKGNGRTRAATRRRGNSDAAITVRCTRGAAEINAAAPPLGARTRRSLRRRGLLAGRRMPPRRVAARSGRRGRRCGRQSRRRGPGGVAGEIRASGWRELDAGANRENGARDSRRPNDPIYAADGGIRPRRRSRCDRASGGGTRLRAGNGAAQPVRARAHAQARWHARCGLGRCRGDRGREGGGGSGGLESDATASVRSVRHESALEGCRRQRDARRTCERQDQTAARDVRPRREREPARARQTAAPGAGCRSRDNAWCGQKSTDCRMRRVRC